MAALDLGYLILLAVRTPEHDAGQKLIKASRAAPVNPRRRSSVSQILGRPPAKTGTAQGAVRSLAAFNRLTTTPDDNRRSTDTYNGAVPVVKACSHFVFTPGNVGRCRTGCHR
jgi:hypothetical protein